MSEPIQALANIIDGCQPKTMVALGETSEKLASRWSEHHGCDATFLTPDDAKEGLTLPEVQDLAMITDTLEHIDHARGQTLIGLLRNYGTRQIAVLVTENSGWNQSDFVGLGFKRQAKIEENGESLALYTYNISNYNHKRTWNNPRFWANPEMWDKARW
ncbi:DUF6231 family protein [Gilvimarinus xylanilyticus]|uniref:DUF6231 family protein n=1 Tax=Gilvimarinus xylanilyticus TaxID=2944139 RepID=A0A9X2I213_9GAMM|nr:DUF6231 family protein [Gilvimarinus xylanilyticus]MCP8898701.1 DUF6231 family protein [Gilvimarinus xylanilyticus]